MIELAEGVVDYGDAPEIYISGPARVSRLSDNLVRMTYYAEHEEAAGVERRVVLHVLRDIDIVERDLTRTKDALRAARGERPISARRP